jgi:hypothetical protein
MMPTKQKRDGPTFQFEFAQWSVVLHWLEEAIVPKDRLVTNLQHTTGRKS